MVSRGEGKALVFAVLLGSAQVLAQGLARPPLVLVDELASELDPGNREKVSAMLREVGLQTFVTAVSENLVTTEGWGRVAHLQLSRGEVRPVLQ